MGARSRSVFEEIESLGPRTHEHPLTDFHPKARPEFADSVLEHERQVLGGTPEVAHERELSRQNGESIALAMGLTHEMLGIVHRVLPTPLSVRDGVESRQMPRWLDCKSGAITSGR